MHPVALGDLAVDQVEWVDDHRLVAVAGDLGAEGLAFVGSTPGLFRFDLPADLAGPVEGVRLTDLDTDLGEPGSRVVVVGDHVLLSVRDRGAVRLERVAVDAEPGTVPEVLVDGQRLVRGAAATPDGSTVAVVITSPERSGDLGVLEGGDVRLLTDLSAPVRATGRVRPLHERVGHQPRRVPRPRMGGAARPRRARGRPLPGAAQHPRRAVHDVRLDAVRRGAGLRRRRLRRGAVQPARVGRLRPRPRPGGQGRFRGARRRRRRRVPGRTCWRTTRCTSTPHASA